MVLLYKMDSSSPGNPGGNVIAYLPLPSVFYTIHALNTIQKLRSHFFKKVAESKHLGTEKREF